MTAFPNLVYSEFDTTQANLLADIRTVLLSCAAVSRPNSAAKPDTYKITTSRGADIIFDLQGAALTTANMSIDVWRSYDGTTFTDSVRRYLHWKTSGGATTTIIHCIVSVSKEHVFISTEGPRGGESGADNGTYGSTRVPFFVCDVVPYFAADTVPFVFAGGMTHTTNQTSSTGLASHIGHLTKNYSGSTPWSPARLLTLGMPGDSAISLYSNYQRQGTIDGKYYCFPYVVHSETDGLRGRLLAFHHAGQINGSYIDTTQPQPPIGQKITYDGNTYKLIAVHRSGSSQSYWSQFGSNYNRADGGQALNSHVVAVPAT